MNDVPRSLAGSTRSTEADATQPGRPVAVRTGPYATGTSPEHAGPAPSFLRLGLGKLADGLTFVAYPGGFIVLVLALWEAATHVFSIEPFILPPPTNIAVAFWEDWSLILFHTWPTLAAISLGFALAAWLGICIAVLVTAVPLIGRMIYPLLVASLVVPKIAVAPLFLIWFGYGLQPKIVIVILISFFPIVVDMTLGLQSVGREMHMLVRSMGASAWNAFWKVRFMHSLPHLFAGLKVGMALAVVGAIVGEFVGSDSGLGYLILVANARLNTDQFFAIVLQLSLLGIILYAMIVFLEWVIVRNRRP